jgi:transposase InsO family protein
VLRLFEVRDVRYRCHYVFVVMHLQTRRLSHAVTTTEPTAMWLAQQLRELTPSSGGPRFLLRDNDRKFGAAFDAVACGVGTSVIRTPILAPKANGNVERLIGTLRRECLDHMIVCSEQHLQRLLDEDRHFYNDARPHQGIEQRQPAQVSMSARSATPVAGSTVASRAVLGGLHHDCYRQAA